MKDHYKTLNVPFEASETEIKKQFRKLAVIHHPDRNGGSKKSETTFKEILNAYETLYDKQKRTMYDLKYKQFFKQTKPKTRNQNNTNFKDELPNQPDSRQHENIYPKKAKPRAFYGLLIVLVLFTLIYLNYTINKKSLAGNPKGDEQLEQQPPLNRPQSGEINFKK